MIFNSNSILSSGCRDWSAIQLEVLEIRPKTQKNRKQQYQDKLMMRSKLKSYFAAAMIFLLNAGWSMMNSSVDFLQLLKENK